MVTTPPTPDSPRPGYHVGADHHLLAGAKVPPLHREPTPNRGGVLAPTLIVLHYTAAAGAAGSVAWLCDKRSKVSAHLVVERTGEAWQLAPFNVQTWHAGVSAWKGKTSLNHHAIGIEMANRGALAPAIHLAPHETLTAAHKRGGPLQRWERYAAAQVQAVAGICAALLARYPGITEIVGHDDISPNRKQDPGPAWDWDAFRAAMAVVK